MGKHYWIKHGAAVDDHNTSHKQPGCVWGLVHALNYHQWQTNRTKMINNHQKKLSQKSPKRDSSSKILAHDEVEVEKLLEEKENLFPNAQRPRSRKKKSLRARLKSLIVKEKLSSKPRLHRTYSIHHLGDSDDGKRRIIFLPGKKNIESTSKSHVYDRHNKASGKPDDVLEIFRVDKGLLIKHLRDADETLASFSRSALGLGLNPGAKFGKSRSFPNTHQTPQRRRRLRPVKLEDKKIEVWSSFSKEEDKPEEVNEHLEGGGNNTIKPTHRRSSSLIESLDKYTNLYDRSFLSEPKLRQSKSLRVATGESEHHVPAYFRRLRSMSNVDSYQSFVNFEAIRDEFSKITEEEQSLGMEYVEEEEDADTISLNAGENSNVDENDTTESVITIQDNNDDVVEDGERIDEKTPLSKIVFEHEEVTISSENCNSTLDSNTALQETESQDVRKDKQHMSHDSTPQQETDRINTNKTQLTKNKQNDSDLNYTRCLLDHSGIAQDASERTWHSYDQPLSPRLFEEVESLYYTHKGEDSAVPEDLSGLWHHQMLFDLVNEKLVEIYDISLPYYAKALSQTCRVRPFPKGNRIVEDVLKSVGALSEDRDRSLDRVMARDFDNDYSWMNLQIESEMKALEIEDIILEELVEEIIYSSC